MRLPEWAPETLLFLTACCECLEGFAVDAHDAPLVEHVGAHLFVEVDCGLVPVEDVPLEAVAVLDPIPLPHRPNKLSSS